MSINKKSSILIIGGGSWGCCTALELAKRGYTNVHVLDGEEVPSPISAGNDLNKIMEEATPSGDDTDADYFFNRIQQIAGEAWRNDPLLKPFYHETGFIMCACRKAVYEEHCVSYVKDLKEHCIALDTAEDFRKTMPNGVLTGPLPSWRGFLRPKNSGWVFARGAMTAMYEEAQRLGAKFTTGESGRVTQLLVDSDRSICRGARTQDGVQHTGDKTILCAGANSDLLLDFQKQLRPTAWTLAHISLTPSEAQLYKDLPVLYNAERGFFIEPSTESNELKLCDEHPGYVNMQPSPYDSAESKELRSIPVAKQQIPLVSERRIRNLLRETMPRLAERPFSFARLCWDADTVDRKWLIDWHPEIGGLLLAAGASGHGFGTMPAVGKMVGDLLEGRLEERLRRVARWRPEQAVERDWWDTQGRHGVEDRVMEVEDVEGWTRIGEGKEKL